MEYQSPFLLVMVQVLVLCYGRNLYIIAQNVNAVQGLPVVTVFFAACPKSINFFYFSHI